MTKEEIQEAAAIIRRTLDVLLLAIKHKDRRGADARRACGEMQVTAEQQIFNNTVAEPLGKCFELVRLAGANLPEMGRVRQQAWDEVPKSVTATLVAQTCVMFCLENEALIISNMDFTSRQDVERIQQEMTKAFADAAEVACDLMVSSAYMAITSLGGAVTFFLYDAARPLPRMVRFQFAQPGTTLVFAYRLYDNAGRADELRRENKVVHPAFMRRTGQALSA